MSFTLMMVTGWLPKQWQTIMARVIDMNTEIPMEVSGRKGVCPYVFTVESGAGRKLYREGRPRIFFQDNYHLTLYITCHN